MREVYTKNDIYMAIEGAMSDGVFKSAFLRELVEVKLNRLEREYSELYVEYEEYYLPHIKRSEASENYTVSQPFIKKINKCVKNLNSITKQKAFYISLKKNEYSNIDPRAKSVLRDIKRHMKVPD